MVNMECISHEDNQKYNKENNQKNSNKKKSANTQMVHIPISYPQAKYATRVIRDNRKVNAVAGIGQPSHIPSVTMISVTWTSCDHAASLCGGCSLFWLESVYMCKAYTMGVPGDVVGNGRAMQGPCMPWYFGKQHILITGKHGALCNSF